MSKIEIKSRTFLYPMPTVLVGANVDDRPNYVTIAFCGIVNMSPPMIAFATSRSRYTNRGIEQNGSFSVNIPSVDMVAVTDYCGLVTGQKVDKSRLFKNFYGKLGTAPMIEECPLNLECKLYQKLELPSHYLFIGEIVATYTEDRYLEDGLPDIQKMQPIAYSMYDNNYWKIGEHLGRALSIGKDYKEK